MARAAPNVLNVSSQFFLMQPWGRDQEYEADKLGMFIAHLAGYNIREVPVFWREFAGENASTFDFFSTHPADEKRIAVMIQSEVEILNRTDFYSRPLMPETPSPKDNVNALNTNTQAQPTFNNNQTQAQPMSQISNQSTVGGPVSEGNIGLCPSCGTIAFNGKVCINCGYSVEHSNDLRCQNCGAIINRGDSFCTNCGMEIGAVFYCKFCGSKVKRGDTFCTNCGHKLD